MSSYVGSALGSISQMFGGAPWAGSMPSPSVAAGGPSDSSISTTPVMGVGAGPTTGVGYTGPSTAPISSSPSYGPAPLVDPSGAGTAGSVTPPAQVSSGDPSMWGSGSAPPVPTPTPEQVMGAPGAANYSSATAAPGAGTGTGDQQSSWISSIIKAVTGKDPSKGGTGAFIGDVGNLGQSVQRWIMQQRLQNPQSLLSNSQVLARGLSKGLKRDVGAATGQEMAAAGLAGAPNLYAQAITSALAPYRFQEQQNALQQYLAAMELSSKMYPGEGGMYGPYGGYGQYPGEEEANKQASPA